MLVFVLIYCVYVCCAMSIDMAKVRLKNRVREHFFKNNYNLLN